MQHNPITPEQHAALQALLEKQFHEASDLIKSFGDPGDFNYCHYEEAVSGIPNFLLLLNPNPES